MNVGKNIAKFRKAKKLTQEELGVLLGVSNQAVSKWESETSMPDIMLLPKIAEALDVTLEALYGITVTKVTKDFAFVDCSYKVEESEKVFDVPNARYTLMYLTDQNLRKILNYQYKTAFKNPQMDNGEFTFDEIMQACCLTKEEAGAALHLLNEVNINETYVDKSTGEKKYVFKISNATYALAIYKLAEMLHERKTC